MTDHVSTPTGRRAQPSMTVADWSARPSHVDELGDAFSGVWREGEGEILHHLYAARGADLGGEAEGFAGGCGGEVRLSEL